jgi:CubicO group peptidase (beta-lactamase class C family)
MQSTTRGIGVTVLLALLSPAMSVGSADAGLAPTMVSTMTPGDTGLAPTITSTMTPTAAPAGDLAQCRALGLAQCPVPFDAALPPAKDMLTWSKSERVVGFRNTYRQYRADAFHADPSNVYALPESSGHMAPPRYRVRDQTFGLEDYLQHQDVTGLLVLKDGQIAYEYYGHGNTASTLWTSRSVAKSVVSILIGIAIREGSIKSVEDPITRYLPELRHTAWEGVSLRNLLQHTSGVAWNENYRDPKSDFAALTRCEAGAEPYECVLKLVRDVHRKSGVKPGEVWSYNTGCAWLVGRVLEAATGMPISRYLETRLWRRLGMQSDGVWEALVEGKIDMGGHGFNATLRDWGRFGLFVAGGGKLRDGTELLPHDWLAQSTAWTHAKGSVDESNPKGQYGYQWWHAAIPKGADADLKALADRTLWAEGIFGQVIAIDPSQHVVMVQWSTYADAEGTDELGDEQVLFLHALEEALGGVASSR